MFCARGGGAAIPRLPLLLLPPSRPAPPPLSGGPAAFAPCGGPGRRARVSGPGGGGGRRGAAVGRTKWKQPGGADLLRPQPAPSRPLRTAAAQRLAPR